MAAGAPGAAECSETAFGAGVEGPRDGQVETPMPTADQVKALIRSHAEGDDARFYAVAMQVAASEARSGHGRFAQELRELVDDAKAKAHRGNRAAGSRPVPVAQPRGELAGVLTASYPKVRLADLALDDVVRSRIEGVLEEQRERARIHEHGLSPLRKLLLIGPPGTGKTTTAAVLAGELGLPLFTIQLHALITKYLGETAGKLHLVFDAIAQSRGVYLFDEFDAIGVERGARNDVGEIRRVLNSFLQFLENDQSDGLVVAATNHSQLLDKALFRRFDAVIEYQLPAPSVAEQVLRNRLSLLDASRLAWPEIVEAAHDLSHAELVRACEAAAKKAILARRRRVSTAEVLAALADRRAAR